MCAIVAHELGRHFVVMGRLVHCLDRAWHHLQRVDHEGPWKGPSSGSGALRICLVEAGLMARNWKTCWRRTVLKPQAATSARFARRCSGMTTMRIPRGAPVCLFQAAPRFAFGRGEAGVAHTLM